MRKLYDKIGTGPAVAIVCAFYVYLYLIFGPWAKLKFRLELLSTHKMKMEKAEQKLSKYLKQYSTSLLSEGYSFGNYVPGQKDIIIRLRPSPKSQGTISFYPQESDERYASYYGRVYIKNGVVVDTEVVSN